MYRYDRSKRGRQSAGRARSQKPPVAEDLPTDFPPTNGSPLRTLTRGDLSMDRSVDKGVEKASQSSGKAGIRVLDSGGAAGNVKSQECRLAVHGRLQGTKADCPWEIHDAKETDVQVGAPPRWTPPADPVTLKQDDGQYFRDVNAAHFPKFPMEPAVRASMQMKADFDLQSIELCACSSTLGSLLRFARDVKKPFRFWVEVVGGTAFFIRRERSPKELIENVGGYGHTFPEAYTTWPQEVRGSVSHQRILSYSLAGMKHLVRFEGDGYLEESVGNATRPDAGVSRGKNKQLAEAMSELFRNDDGGPENGKLTLESGGSLVAQQAIFDLKTRSIKKKDQDILTEECPRLWLSQIPNMILAFHSYGKFESINVKNVTKDVKSWEKNNQDDLKRFVGLTKLIVKEASQTGAKKLEVRATIEGKLELRDLSEEDWSALPPDLKEYWTSSQEASPKKVEQEHDDGSGGKTAAPSGSASLWFDIEDHDNDGKDYTACSKDCGYCGHCPY